MSPNLKHGFTGTTAYSSANCHLDLAPSRRDDLESWFYCLIEFVTGSLPWDTQHAKDAKAHLSAKQICDGMPTVGVKVFLYIKGLSFEGTPDYDYIFRTLD
jgi:hypothetical protein